MSAAAVHFINDSEILIHSDGGSKHFQTGELLSKNSSKIFKLSDRCAIIHLGSFPEFSRSAIENIRGTYMADLPPGEIAHGVGQALEAFIDVRGEDPTRDYLFFTVGFDDLGDPELWQMLNISERGREYGFEGTNPFVPEKIDFNPGDSFAVATGVPRSKADFNERLANYRKQGLHEKAASYWAFVDFVENLESEGVLVGGQIFAQALTPPSQELQQVSLTDMNEFMSS